ncbi:Modification methylase Eco47II [Symbiodinium microadriaticum]|uniref:Modification methylase Eco47II n=1 Tax=Symbiodinium microadriaticum TaxID=2951 RepID=A0A1Q9CV57_SYMMI|nr:Modification methylase Eco47II [Symbiodinium microadriaticum]
MLATGESCDLAALLLGKEGELTVFMGLWHQETFLVRNRAFADGIWTLYGVILVGWSSGLPVLECTDETRTIHKQPRDIAAYQSLNEVCAGISGMSVAAKALSMRPGLCLDKSDLACAVLRRNGLEAVQGDLNNRQDRIAFHKAVSGAASLLVAGFPCQPFSMQGDRAGMQDIRSNTLLQVLRLAWHLQAPGLVLECVAAVQDFPEAMQAIQQLAHKLDYSFEHVVLELADQWPCKRKRWWGVLLPKLKCPLGLSNWPLSTAHPCIRDVIPEWPCWPTEQILDLAWTQQETEMYESDQFGSDCRRYDANGVAPTALHSYGCALRSCPCGCRSQPLSLQRLMQGGFRGVGVVDVTTGQLRFAHPSELGLLNTLPADFCYADSARDSLCLVGQVAAPLQALWVFAHITVWSQANLAAQVHLQYGRNWRPVWPHMTEIEIDELAAGRLVGHPIH